MTIKLLKKNIYKYFRIKKQKKAGRNKKGTIILRHRGGGINFFYKPTNLKLNGYLTFYLGNTRNKHNFLNITQTDTEKNQIKNKLHFFVKNYDFLDVISNDWKPLKTIDTGTFISYIENKNKIIYCKAAGSKAQIIDQQKTSTIIKLPSSKLLTLNNYNHAFPSQTIHFKKIKKKAGYSRWLNKRPRVRGVAMNPVDHPHGGGEGKTSGGRPSVSIWGWYTK